MALALIASALVLASAVDLERLHCFQTSSWEWEGTIAGTTTLIGKSKLGKELTGGSFSFVARWAKFDPVLKLAVEASGSICEDTVINFPDGGGLVFHGLDCPVPAGDVELSLSLSLQAGWTAGVEEPIGVSLSASTDTGATLPCALDFGTVDQESGRFPMFAVIVAVAVLAVLLGAMACVMWCRHVKRETKALEVQNTTTTEAVSMGKVVDVDDVEIASISTALPADSEMFSYGI